MNKKIYYRFHGTLGIAEIQDQILNRIVLRIKQPLCKGDVLEIKTKNDVDFRYVEVISQKGCFVTVWDR